MKYLLIPICISVTCSMAHSAIPERWTHQHYVDEINERKILTFVDIQNKDGKDHLHIEALGRTSVSAERAINAMWAEQCWSERISSVHSAQIIGEKNHTSKVVYVVASIWRLYWLRSYFKITRDPKKPIIQFEFISAPRQAYYEGDFTGLKGEIELIESGTYTTVVLNADLIRDKIHLPKIVVKFALGLALKQAGWALRDVMEAPTDALCLTSIR